MNPHTLSSVLSRTPHFVKYIRTIHHWFLGRNVLGVGVNKVQIALVLFASSVATAMGQGGTGGTGGAGGGQTITFSDPLGGKTFGDVAKAIIDQLVLIAAPILGIMVIWGGIQLMTAAGNEQKISAGRKTLTWAAVGFAIIVGWQLISELISDILKG
jgi:hypothetical protein